MRAFFSVYLLIFWVFLTPLQADTHHPQEFLQSITGAKDEGIQIYNHFCVNCHAEKPLISLGAPRIGDEKDWQLRLNQGFAVLFKHTDEGFNAMPARGGCFECTDKQLILAMIAMVPKKEQKELFCELEKHK